MTWDELDDLYAPPTPAGLPAHVRARQRAELVARIKAEQSLAHGARPRRHRRWHARTVGVLAAIGLLGGSVATAAVLLARPPDVTDVANCYAVAEQPLDDPARYEEVAFVHQGDLVRSAEVALELCAAQWAQGTLAADPPYVRPQPEFTDPPTEHPVPPLIACIVGDGRVGVFPGGASTCEALGIPPSLDGETAVTRLGDVSTGRAGSSLRGGPDENPSRRVGSEHAAVGRDDEPGR